MIRWDGVDCALMLFRKWRLCAVSLRTVASCGRTAHSVRSVAVLSVDIIVIIIIT